MRRRDFEGKMGGKIPTNERKALGEERVKNEN
jgi:hypothetical protein